MTPLGIGHISLTLAGVAASTPRDGGEDHQGSTEAPAAGTSGPVARAATAGTSGRWKPPGPGSRSSGRWAPRANRSFPLLGRLRIIQGAQASEDAKGVPFVIANPSLLGHVPKPLPLGNQGAARDFAGFGGSLRPGAFYRLHGRSPQGESSPCAHKSERKNRKIGRESRPEVRGRAQE